MKALAPLAAALVAGAGVYGALAAADRKLPPPPDPWLEAWLQAGLKAQFRVETDDPAKSLLFYDARGLFNLPGLDDLPIRLYQVAATTAQVVLLPNERALLQDLPEGRHFDFRLKPKGGTAHVCRAGRRILFVSSQPNNVPLVGPVRVPRKSVETVFQAFEGAAR
ncbi:MAG TPA: hypothetical protein VF950_28340 [Planctomycetota bacterium]